MHSLKTVKSKERRDDSRRTRDASRNRDMFCSGLGHRVQIVPAPVIAIKQPVKRFAGFDAGTRSPIANLIFLAGYKAAVLEQSVMHLIHTLVQQMIDSTGETGSK